MEMIEEPQVYHLATCHTEGCGNAEIPISVPDNGALTGCGVCEALIVDFSPTPLEGSADA